jgi:hypothetical protein
MFIDFIDWLSFWIARHKCTSTPGVFQTFPALRFRGRPQIPERRKEREGKRHGVVCRDEKARRVRRWVVLEGDRNSRFVKQVLGERKEFK